MTRLLSSFKFALCQPREIRGIMEQSGRPSLESVRNSRPQPTAAHQSLTYCRGYLTAHLMSPSFHPTTVIVFTLTRPPAGRFASSRQQSAIATSAARAALQNARTAGAASFAHSPTRLSPRFATPAVAVSQVREILLQAPASQPPRFLPLQAIQRELGIRQRDSNRIAGRRRATRFPSRLGRRVHPAEGIHGRLVDLIDEHMHPAAPDAFRQGRQHVQPTPEGFLAGPAARVSHRATASAHLRASSL